MYRIEIKNWFRKVFSSSNSLHKQSSAIRIGKAVQNIIQLYLNLEVIN